MIEDLEDILNEIAGLPEMQQICKEGWVIHFVWNPEDNKVELWFCYPTKEARERDRERLKERRMNQ
jgi:hypothetical protein